MPNAAITPRLRRMLSELISGGPATVSELSSATSFPSKSVSSTLYELRRLGLAENGSNGERWENGASSRKWRPTDAGRQELSARDENGDFGAAKTLPAWTIDRLQDLFATPSRDFRMPGSWGLNWSMDMLRKKTRLPERTLLAMLVPENGFAFHDEKWSYNPLLVEYAMEKRGLGKEEAVRA